MGALSAMPTPVVTGPATDNAAAARLVEQQTGAPARNARTQAEELAAIVLERLGIQTQEAARNGENGAARSMAAAAGGGFDDL